MKFFRVKPAKERKVVFLAQALAGHPRGAAVHLRPVPGDHPALLRLRLHHRAAAPHLLRPAGLQDLRPLFDAAWGNEDTQTLIDIFDKYNVKVTFFVVGEWVDKYPESVKALADAGHEVMGHSNDHAHFNTLSADQIVEDINTCNDKIEKITGKRPTLFRPPFGEYDDLVITTVRGMGIEPIQWDVDSLDWKDYDAATITQRVTSSVGPGSIVLFHNAALHTPEALPDILEYLLGEGYEIVPISQLILDGEYGTDYTIDHTGRQCPGLLLSAFRARRTPPPAAGASSTGRWLCLFPLLCDGEVNSGDIVLGIRRHGGANEILLHRDPPQQKSMALGVRLQRQVGGKHLGIRPHIDTGDRPKRRQAPTVGRWGLGFLIR